MSKKKKSIFSKIMKPKKSACCSMEIVEEPQDEQNMEESQDKKNEEKTEKK